MRRSSSRFDIHDELPGLEERLPLPFVSSERQMANPAFNRLYSGHGVHEAHGLDDHPLVTEGALEHNLSCGDIRLDAKRCRGTAKALIECRVDF
jgi:hypothetical protein